MYQFKESLNLPTDVITEVRLNSDNTQLALISENIAYVFVTSGDCCSCSWIEHVEDKENIIGKRVTKIEQVDYEILPESENGYPNHPERNQEELKSYITRFWS